MCRLRRDFGRKLRREAAIKCGRNSGLASVGAMASPRRESPREGKEVGFDGVEDAEQAQRADRLAVATKKGAEREALSAARDAAKMQAKNLVRGAKGKPMKKAMSGKMMKYKSGNFKPDYLDMDKDGNKNEPMKKALKDRRGSGGYGKKKRR